jgi:hypothetical protein
MIIVGRDFTPVIGGERKGEVWIDGPRTNIKSDVAIVVPAGVRHNVKNIGEKPLNQYPLYAPPEHVHGPCMLRKSMRRLPRNLSTERARSSSDSPGGGNPGLCTPGDPRHLRLGSTTRLSQWLMWKANLSNHLRA